MAEGKKSFILYCDIKHTVDHLTNDQAGLLFKHIVDYVNDLNPETDNVIVKIAFEPIKLQLKRDLKNWESERNVRSQAGRIGGLKSGETRRNQAEAKRSTASKSEANEAVTVNVTDTVTERESTEHAQKNHLLESNLFRKPLIPTFDKVHEVFLNNGGTKEMALKFYDTHKATEWYLRGSPIKNFSSLVPGYIQTWEKNSEKSNSRQPNNQILPNGLEEQRAEALKNYRLRTPEQ